VLRPHPVGAEPVPGAVGVPAPATAIRIVDAVEGTRILSVGQQGEIRARGPQLMRGYATCRRRPGDLRDGWLHTGDIGEIDGAGPVWIRDRKKDMAIVGGYNVYPRETTRCSIPSRRAPRPPQSACRMPMGEVIKAFVVARPGAGLEAAR